MLRLIPAAAYLYTAGAAGIAEYVSGSAPPMLSLIPIFIAIYGVARIHVEDRMITRMADAIDHGIELHARKCSNERAAFAERRSDDTKPTP